MSSTTRADAESLIRQTEARVTTPRVKVLEFLLAQTEPLTHHEIQARMDGATIDPVTLYRVLEWLSEMKLAHRIAGADQVWRFSAGDGQQAHEHAHFQCTRCATVTCFPEVKLPSDLALPKGFQSEEVDYLIKGICPRCR